MIEYFKENVWVWAGTALVLLTLSGATLRRALIIVTISAVVHLVITMFTAEKE